VRTVAQRGSHHGRRRRRVEAIEKGVDAEVDAVRSRRARRSRVCRARKCLGDDGTHRRCQYRTCEGGCTTKGCLRDQQRRPPRRSQAQNGIVEEANAARCCWSRRRGRTRRRCWRRGGAGRSEEMNPNDLAHGLMIRMMRRRSSKKTTKNPNSLMKTVHARCALT
jgi:hypothetical protein